MRLPLWILALLVAASVGCGGLARRQDDAMLPNSFQISEWRRTKRGWERPSTDWPRGNQLRVPAKVRFLHPMLIAVAQLVGSLAAFSWFPPRNQTESKLGELERDSRLTSSDWQRLSASEP